MWTERPSLPLYLKGTNFQIQVWQALLKIPAGTAVAYGTVAQMIGNPKASRAVGSATGSNPIGLPHPLPPRHPAGRWPGRLPLGQPPQEGDPGLGVGPLSVTVNGGR
jgi:hypothetical protein